MSLAEGSIATQSLPGTMDASVQSNSSFNKPLDATSSEPQRATPAISTTQQAISTRVAPPYLPPKSPSSVNGKTLLSITSTSTKPHRRRIGKSKERRRKSSSNRSLSGESLVDESLADPCPDHLNVATDSDDLSSVADFSMVSFEKASSPTSVTDPLKNINQIKPSHRKAKSWDAGDCYQESTSKTCIPVPAIFRRQKVMSADVASLSNASDTIISVEKGRLSGRELHEKAKAVLNTGDYEKAVTMFEALQEAHLERFGENHSSVGAAMHNVGVVRLRMQQHETAEKTLVRAVAIRRNVLGDDHLDLAASLAKLGSARVVLQKFDEALRDLRESLRITRKTLGRSHKTVAQILCHMACLYFEAGELFSAQATFEDALEIFREVFASEQDRDGCMAQMTETLCNIGSIQNRRRNFSGAIESFREALDLQRGIMGHDHPRVIASLDNLGYSFSKNKSYNQALTCYKEMLNAQISRQGAFTMDYCDTMKKQILIYEKLKNADGAMKAAKKALEKVKGSSIPTKGPVVAELQKMLLDLRYKREKRRCSKACF